MKTWFIGFTFALAAIVAGVVIAPVSHAVTATTIPFDCADTRWPTAGARVEVSGSPGDELTFTFSGVCKETALYNTPNQAIPGWLEYASKAGSTGAANTSDPDGWWDVALNLNVSGTASVTVVLLAANVDRTPTALAANSAIGLIQFSTTGMTSYNDIEIFYVGSGGAAADETGQAPGSPPAVYQSLPMPASGSCSDVQDADFAWGTGLVGGWRKSWQPWVVQAGALGGWACERTLLNRGGHRWLLGD